MLTLPNLLSLLRIPLALAFFQDNPVIRAWAIAAALFTDGLDGYLARKFKSSSAFGTIIDPLTDKLFALIALIVLHFENKIGLGQAASLLCRDFAVLVFGCYLVFKGQLSRYRFRAIWSGKLFTFFQFPVLLSLVLGYEIPFWTYGFFVILGGVALLELYFSEAVPGETKTS